MAGTFAVKNLKIKSGGVFDHEDAAKGGLLVFDTAAADLHGSVGSFVPLSVGADGRVLEANSAATAGVSWEVPAAGSAPSDFTRTVVSSAGPYAVPNVDALLAVTYTATGAITLNLPDAGTTKRVINIKDEGGSAATNNITIVPDGSDTIEGFADAKIEADYGFVSLYFDGASTWMVGAPP